MGFGLHDSLYMYADPATAILYLLHLMYINMQVNHNLPPEVKSKHDCI